METRQNYLTSRFNQVQVGDVFVAYIQQTMCWPVAEKNRRQGINF